MNSQQSRFGIYRGIVVYNIDPLCKGRVKLYVYGIYPIQYKDQYEYLPWAQPAMSIFGGNWTNQRTGLPQQLNIQTGICAVPHASTTNTDGAQVFLFFEAGDINKPIYFASAQTGPGWFSQHPNQYVIQTDNVRVRIDEQNKDLVFQKYGTAVNKSTCFFTTFNGKCHSSHQARQIKKALIDVEVKATDDIGINLIVHGDVNIQINGNKYEEVIGDIYQSHIGNRYISHTGDTYIQDNGNINKQINGNNYVSITGEQIKTVYENYSLLNNNFNFKVDKGGNTNLNIGGTTNICYCNNVNKKYATNETINYNGTLTLFALDYIINAGGQQVITITKGKETINNTLSVKSGATGIVTLTNVANVSDGIVIGIG